LSPGPSGGDATRRAPDAATTSVISPSPDLTATVKLTTHSRPSSPSILSLHLSPGKTTATASALMGNLVRRGQGGAARRVQSRGGTTLRQSARATSGLARDHRRAVRPQLGRLDEARMQVSERYEVRHDMYRRVTHLLSRSKCAERYGMVVPESCGACEIPTNTSCNLPLVGNSRQVVTKTITWSSRVTIQDGLARTGRLGA
jgi:hypothetical protein